MLLEYPVKITHILVSGQLRHRLDRNAPLSQPHLRLLHAQLHDIVRDIAAILLLKDLA
ncbi:hypothetical protein D3C72_2543510 [compost metagenome]